MELELKNLSEDFQRITRIICWQMGGHTLSLTTNRDYSTVILSDNID